MNDLQKYRQGLTSGKSQAILDAAYKIRLCDAYKESEKCRQCLDKLIRLIKGEDG